MTDASLPSFSLRSMNREYESSFSRLLKEESRGADDLVRSASAVDLSYTGKDSSPGGASDTDSAHNSEHFGSSAGFGKDGLFGVSRDDGAVPSNLGRTASHGDAFSDSAFGLPNDLSGMGGNMVGNGLTGATDVVSAFSNLGLGTDVPLRPSTAPLPPHGAAAGQGYVNAASRFGGETQSQRSSPAPGVGAYGGLGAGAGARARARARVWTRTPCFSFNCSSCSSCNSFKVCLLFLWMRSV